MRRIVLIWNTIFALTGVGLVIVSAMNFGGVFSQLKPKTFTQLDSDSPYRIRRFKLNKGRYVLPILHKRKHRMAKRSGPDNTAFIQNAAHLKPDKICEPDVLPVSKENSRLVERCIKSN